MITLTPEQIEKAKEAFRKMFEKKPAVEETNP